MQPPSTKEETDDQEDFDKVLNFKTEDMDEDIGMDDEAFENPSKRVKTENL